MSNAAVTLELSDQFAKLASEWKSLTRYMVNSVQMATAWPYQQIIGLGQPAIPFILRELERETDHWFWALEAISGENPVSTEQAGDANAMALAWLDWGRQKGLI
jgi:hypothetical protein